MGHVDIASTQVYLNVAGELLGPVNKRFHNHFRGRRPEGASHIEAVSAQVSQP